MKTKIFSIALLFVMLFTLLIPLSASASGGNVWYFNDELTSDGLTCFDLDTSADDLSDYIFNPDNLIFIETVSIDDADYNCLLPFSSTSISGDITYNNFTVTLFHYDYVDNTPIELYAIYNGAITTEELAILPTFQVVSIGSNVDEWLQLNTYRDTPDMDNGTTQETAIIPKGNYTLKDNITFPNGSTTINFDFYVNTLVEGVGITQVHYDTMTFDMKLVAYSNDSSSKVAFYGIGFSNYGWVMSYNLIHVETDQTVPKEYYDIFMNNVHSYNNVLLKTYGTVILPDIDSVWTDKTTYPAMAIYYVKETGTYRLAIGNSYVKDYVHNDETFGQVYYRIGPNYIRYNLEGTEWVFYDEGDNSTVNLVGQAELVWTSHPIYTDETRSALFFHKGSSLVNSLTVPMMTSVTKEILMILPIGMVCLISYLALRKGLRILVQVSRTA